MVKTSFCRRGILPLYIPQLFSRITPGKCPLILGATNSVSALVSQKKFVHFLKKKVWRGSRFPMFTEGKFQNRKSVASCLLQSPPGAN